MVHVSRMAEELVLWSSPSFGYVSLGEGFSTGSSIMPQKLNPDAAELMRGKSGRVFGHLMGLLTVMKGLPLAYNSDMQEDKEAAFDGVDTVTAVLDLLPGMLRGLELHEKPMKEAAARDFSNATDLADRLTQAGMPFRQAHHRVGGLVRRLLERGYTAFSEVPPDVWHDLAPDIAWEWTTDLTPEHLADARNQPFGPARPRIQAQLKALRSRIGSA